MTLFLDVLIAVTAFVAAGFWLKSALVPVPVIRLTVDMTNLEKVSEPIRKTAKLSQYGALSAGLSAICAGFRILLPYVGL